MKLSSEVLDAILTEDEPGKVETKQIGTRRWVLTMRMVFQWEGKLYTCTYDEPRAETVEADTWHSDMVECVEVEPVAKTYTDYVAKASR